MGAPSKSRQFREIRRLSEWEGFLREKAVGLQFATTKTAPCGSRTRKRREGGGRLSRRRRNPNREGSSFLGINRGTFRASSQAMTLSGRFFPDFSDISGF